LCPPTHARERRRTIVVEGLLYRRRNGRPIAPQEIEKINGLILEIGFRFPDLWDEGFREALSTDDTSRAKENVAQVRRDDEVRTTDRQREMRTLDQLRDDFGALHAQANRQAAGLLRVPAIVIVEIGGS
jgi:hypothetical protein